MNSVKLVHFVKKLDFWFTLSALLDSWNLKQSHSYSVTRSCAVVYYLIKTRISSTYIIIVDDDALYKLTFTVYCSWMLTIATILFFAYKLTNSCGTKELHFRWGCTSVPPGEYDWMIHVQWQCSLNASCQITLTTCLQLLYLVALCWLLDNWKFGIIYTL